MTPRRPLRCIILFPVAAGLVFLGLVGAARRGRTGDMACVDGPPWRWPWHPWSLFGVLAVAVCARTYLMCISFHALGGVGPYTRLETGFGAYMLIPFLTALLVVFLEYAIISSNQRLLRAALFCPAIFLFLAAAAQAFHTKGSLELSGLAGLGTHPPLLIAAFGSIMFYIYAAARRVRHAEAALSVGLALCLMFEVKTRFLSSVGVPELAVTLAMGASFLLASIRGYGSLWGMAGISAMALVLLDRYDAGWPERLQSAATLHALFAVAFLGAMLSDDKAARLARTLTALALTPMFLAALFGHKALLPSASGWMIAAYLASLLGVSGAAYLLRGSKSHLCAGAVNLGACGLHGGIELYRLIPPIRLAGLRPMLICALSFAIALAISLRKAAKFRGNHAQGVPQNP